MVGSRYLDLRESLTITQVTLVLAGGSASFLGQPVGPNNVETLQDRFAVHDEFYGGQIGARGSLNRGKWFLEVLGKVALGESREVLDISGASALTPVSAPASFPGGLVPTGPTSTATGGLLATTTNIGHNVRDRFGVVSEFGVNIGCQVCPEMRLFLGYTLLYWGNLLRPGNEVDRDVNLTRVPIHPSFGALVGPSQPMAPLTGSPFWAQGLSAGLEIRY
jgi:hypothetical protein